MTRRVISVEQDATILYAIRVMLQNDVSGLPVLDKSGGLVGALAGPRQ
jgi:CBS domain-containing protein